MKHINNVGVKGMKWGRRKKKVLKGGFVVRRPTLKQFIKKGWKVTKSKPYVPPVVPDPHQVKLVPKKGVEWSPSLPERKKLSQRERTNLDKGLPIRKGVKPGEAFDFKKTKIKAKKGFRFTGKDKNIFLARLPKKADRAWGLADVGKKGFKETFRQKIKKAIRKVRMGGKFELNMSKLIKINMLVSNGHFLERDRKWLGNLDRDKLNILFISHFSVEGDDKKPRSPKGHFATPGGTGHQVRKMNKMGIQARMCSSTT